MTSLLQSLRGGESTRSEYLKLKSNLDVEMETLTSKLIEERRCSEAKDHELEELRDFYAKLNISMKEQSDSARSAQEKNIFLERAAAQKEAKHSAQLASLRIALARMQERVDAAESTLAADSLPQVRDAETQVSMPSASEASESQPDILWRPQAKVARKSEVRLQHEQLLQEQAREKEAEARQELETRDSIQSKLIEAERRVAELQSEVVQELSLRRAAQEEANVRAQQLRRLQERMGDARSSTVSPLPSHRDLQVSWRNVPRGSCSPQQVHRGVQLSWGIAAGGSRSPQQVYRGLHTSSGLGTAAGGSSRPRYRDMPNGANGPTVAASGAAEIPRFRSCQGAPLKTQGDSGTCVMTAGSPVQRSISQGRARQSPHAYMNCMDLQHAACHSTVVLTQETHHELSLRRASGHNSASDTVRTGPPLWAHASMAEIDW
eukprot:CAMPEP_0170574684 /NCGR_PEP_ID=MMETSP0224-20130122/3436_1 /TAXON_ID=285029 /ORGANISM="Togula jolla, Strain CCCM 725" /LENGTH=434 /DNA_ID=CAMNT_0010897367 /DNA_START=14 /DNA_END=1316 /DNA_ORIENTATION=+